LAPVRCLELDSDCVVFLQRLILIIIKEYLAWKKSPSMEASCGFLARIYREDILPCLDFPNTGTTTTFILSQSHGISVKMMNLTKFV
jgi:hypothetical protein